VSPATIIAVVSLVLAFTSFVVNFWLNHRAAVRARKPVLVFVDDHGEKDCWVLENVGNGPALNVIMAEREPKKDKHPGTWLNPVRVPALAKDSEFRLHWLDHVKDRGLGAIYSDFEGRRYTSTAGDEQVFTYEGNRLPKWAEKEIENYWCANLMDVPPTNRWKASRWGEKIGGPTIPE
jgi:hypothetical protein